MILIFCFHFELKLPQTWGKTLKESQGAVISGSKIKERDIWEGSLGFTLNDKKKKCFIRLRSKKPGCDPAKPWAEEATLFDICFLSHRLCHKTKPPDNASLHSPEVRLMQIRPSLNQGSSGSSENIVSKGKLIDFCFDFSRCYCVICLLLAVSQSKV